MKKKITLSYLLILSFATSQISPFSSISFAQPVNIGTTTTTAATATCTTGTCTTTTGTTTTGGTSSDFLSGNNTLSVTTTTPNPQTQQSPDDIFEADRQSNGNIVVRKISVSPPSTVVTIPNTQESFSISNKAIYYAEPTSPAGGFFLRSRNLNSPNTPINYNGNQPVTSVQFDARMPGVAAVTLNGQTQLVDLEAVQGSMTKITNTTFSSDGNKAFTVLDGGPQPLVLRDLNSGASTRITYSNKIWNARVSDDFAFAFVAGTSPTDLTSSSFQYIPLNATNKTLQTPQVQVGTNANGTPIMAALSSVVNILSGSFTEFLPGNQVKFVGLDFKDYVFNLNFNLSTNVVTLTPVAPVGVTLTAAAPVAGTPNQRLSDIRQQVFLNLLGREPDAETLRNFYYANQTISQIQDQVRASNEYFVRTLFISLFGQTAVQSYYNPASATNPIFNKYSDFVTRLDLVYRDWIMGLDSGALPGTAPVQTITNNTIRSKVFEHLTDARFQILFDAYKAELNAITGSNANAAVINKLYADFFGPNAPAINPKWQQALNALGYLGVQPPPLLSPRMLLAQLFMKANTLPNNGTPPDLVQVTSDKTDLVISSGNQLTWYQVTTSNSKLTFKRQVTNDTTIENISVTNTGVYVDGGTTLRFIPFSSPTAAIATFPNIQNVQFVAGLRGVADITENGVVRRVNLSETPIPTVLQTIASPDGKHVLLQQSNHKIVVWHLDTNTSTTLSYPNDIIKISTTPDGFAFISTVANDLTSFSFNFFSLKSNTLITDSTIPGIPSGVTLLGGFGEFITPIQFKVSGTDMKDYIYDFVYDGTGTHNTITLNLVGTPALNTRLNNIRQQVFLNLLGRELDAETLRNFYYSNQTISQMQDQVRASNEYFVRTLFISLFGQTAVQSYYNPASATNPIFNKYSDFVTRLDLVYRDWIMGLDSGTLPGTAPPQTIDRNNLRGKFFDHLTNSRYQILFDAYEASLLQTLNASGNAGVINKIYTDILGHAPGPNDQANVASWINTLAKFRFLGTPPVPPAVTAFDRKETAVDSLWQLFRLQQGQSVSTQGSPDSKFVVTFGANGTFTIYHILPSGKFESTANSPKTIQVAGAATFSVGNEGIHVAGGTGANQFVKLISFANFSVTTEFDFTVGVSYNFLRFMPDMPGVMEVQPTIAGYNSFLINLEGKVYKTDRTPTTNNTGTWDYFGNPVTSPNGDIIVSSNGLDLVVRDRNFNTSKTVDLGNRSLETLTVVNGGIFLASEIYYPAEQQLFEFIPVTLPSSSSGVLTVSTLRSVPLPFPSGISMLGAFLVDFQQPTGNSVIVEIVGKGSQPTDNKVYRFNLTVQPNGQVATSLVTSFTNSRTNLITTIRKTFRDMTEPSREPGTTELRNYLNAAESQNLTSLQVIDNISVSLMSQYFNRQIESTLMEWQARYWANRVGTFIGYLQPDGSITSTATVGGGTTGQQVVLGNINGNPIYGPPGGYAITNMSGVSTVYNANGQQVAVYNANGQVISSTATATGTPLYYTWGTLNVASQWNPPQNVKQYIKDTYGSYPPPASFSVNAAANEQTAYAEYLMTSTLSTLQQNNPTLPWSALVNLAIQQTQQNITHLTNNPPTGFASGFLPSNIPYWVQLNNTILSRLQQLLAHPPGN